MLSQILHTCIQYMDAVTHLYAHTDLKTETIGIYRIVIAYLYMDNLTDLQCKHTKDQLAYIHRHLL